MKSSYLSINWKDASKGFIIAAITSIGSALAVTIEGQHLPTLEQIKLIGLGGLYAGLTYILKNFLTNSDDKFLKKENPQDSTRLPQYATDEKAA